MAKEKPLTKGVLREVLKEELKEYTKEVLLPATFKQMTDYSAEVLIPAIGEVMDVRIKKLRSEINSNFDKVFTDLEMLKQENTIRNAQENREKEFHKIVTKHLETHSTPQEDLAQIKSLDII